MLTKYKLPISTTFVISGVKQQTYIGLVQCEMVMNILNLDSIGHARQIEYTKQEALEQLINDTIELGGNAIVGYKCEMFKINDDKILISAVGTAIEIGQMWN